MGDGGLVGCLVGLAIGLKVLPGMLLHEVGCTGVSAGGWMLQDVRRSTMGVAEIPNMGAGRFPALSGSADV